MRKLALTAHIISSVGWLGAIAGFLALALAGLTSEDPELVRAAYLTMQVTAWTVLVRLALASLVTGLIQSLTTRWGLFRHYWVVVKQLIAVLATAVLLMYTETFGYLGGAGRGLDCVRWRRQRPAEPLSGPPRGGGTPPVGRRGDALGLQPRGMTRYGWRKQHDPGTGRPASTLG